MKTTLSQRRFTFSLLITFLFLLQSVVGFGQTSAVYPGKTWERIEDPASVGYSNTKLDAVKKYHDSIPSTGLVVVVGGKILLENGNIEELSYLASVRKSILAMLYGKYVTNGTVNLNKTLKELNIDDVQGLSDQEKEATIADLLSARSGVYHPASNGGDNLADAPARGSKKRGEYFLYSNWDFNAVGFIFEQETGMDIYDALQNDIAKPIGMQDFDRNAQRKSGDIRRSKYRAYHMWLSTRDMARVGYLMLREGNWNGNQVIAGDWVSKISSLITPLEEMNPEQVRRGRFGYGYLWWIFDGPEATGAYEGAYSGRGAFGQYIMVIPKLDMVVAVKTNQRTTQRKSTSTNQLLRLVDLIIAAKQ